MNTNTPKPSESARSLTNWPHASASRRKTCAWSRNRSPPRDHAALLAADASPRQIAQHLLDQGVIQPGGSFGCWRPEPFGRWATLPTLAHLAGALERLLDRDISLEVAERIGAHVALHGDVADHRAQAKLFEQVGIR